MATKRIAHTVWEGDLLDGRGTVTFDSSGIGEAEVTWASRAQEPDGRTGPEELIAAAHSSCYSMALSNILAKAGTPPTTLHTQAEATFQPGEGITGIHLTVRGEVSGVDAAAFTAAAEDAKNNCPVSQALTGTTITLTATLD
ncbi:OsmC family peroxiredoxin [Streptomyces silvisoli]|uniref:OsmC family peroxiredoxin n=1 Tax=Streptomyces silvisoli TaxID=3034235 RepID=A0ABT5ZW39_9ACTN|nr:OsmC family peroxiredoxin [Streptomyces silvisoli]MDF3294044.1 OsmC family peroxiredoxin [Streptomyces silvisoli]